VENFLVWRFRYWKRDVYVLTTWTTFLTNLACFVCKCRRVKKNFATISWLRMAFLYCKIWISASSHNQDISKKKKMAVSPKRNTFFFFLALMVCSEVGSVPLQGRIKHVRLKSTDIAKKGIYFPASKMIYLSCLYWNVQESFVYVLLEFFLDNATPRIFFSSSISNLKGDRWAEWPPQYPLRRHWSNVSNHILPLIDLFQVTNTCKRNSMDPTLLEH